MSFVRPGTTNKRAFGIDLPKSSQANINQSLTVAPTKFSNGENADALPIESYRRQLLYLIETYGTVVVVGDTGSGKSTLLPQILLRGGWTAGGRTVAVTQPRRVAAITVAARVAEEMGTLLGEEVGFAVRFESAAKEGLTKIKFLTDGVLIREMMDDPLLTNYSVIMVDEAHERSVATDLLLGLLRKIQARRADLRVVISSATLEAGRLAEYFSPARSRSSSTAPVAPGMPVHRDVAVISIDGRCHPVQVHYLQEPTSDYVRTAVRAALDIHMEDVPGDILVFLTGQSEIERAVQELNEAPEAKRGGGGRKRLSALPLYAGLPSARQRQALELPPRGVRRVVVSTSIAETSLTLEGVVYVIDCLYAKQRVYNPITGLEALLVGPISKASATQRAGRAGRVRPGHVFRLCTQPSYDTLLPAVTVPEIQRSELSSVILQLKALGVDNIMSFTWLDPPPAESVIRALETLAALGALDEDGRLTPTVGAPLTALPLDPPLGRALLAAGATGCAAEATAAIALLSLPHLWLESESGRRGMEHFAVSEGDAVSVLNVLKAWREAGRRREWAQKRGLNQHTLLKAEDVSKQLTATLRRVMPPPRPQATLTLDSGDDAGPSEGAQARQPLPARPLHSDYATATSLPDTEPLRRALAVGLVMNAAVLETVVTDAETPAGCALYRLARLGPSNPASPKLRIHASSALARCQPGWVVFVSATLDESGWAEMRGVTPVEPGWLAEAAPHVYRLAKGAQA